MNKISYIRICNYCEGEVQGHSDGGDEIIDICEDCGTVEGPNHLLYEDDKGDYTIDSRDL